MLRAERLAVCRGSCTVLTDIDLALRPGVVFGVLGLWTLGDWISGGVLGILRHGFAFERAVAFDSRLMMKDFGDLFTQAIDTIFDRVFGPQ